MNRDKTCLHPLVWPDVCGHGDGTYVGTVTTAMNCVVQDVYVYDEPDDGGDQVCLREGPLVYHRRHMSLSLFWSAADAYPPWHPARDLLLSHGFVP